MTRIESKTVTVPQGSNEVFDFLSNFNNFEKLMPEQVINWSSDNEKCSFDIKGMATLGMAYEEKVKPNLLRIRKDGKAPFDFFLNCHITDEGDQSRVQLVFDADLNPLLKMMAEKPLTNFLNMLTDKFAELCNANDLGSFTQK